jgi:DNA repair exonuclease SbcCD ATPase subunit
MMLSSESIASFQAAVEDAVAKLPKMDPGFLAQLGQNSPQLPEEHEKFKRRMQEVGQQAAKLDEKFRRHRPTNSVQEGVKTTLDQIQASFERYQQEFEEVQRKATARVASKEDAERLSSLRQAMRPSYTRITFFYQLQVRK